MTIKNIFTTADPVERTARQRMICRRCLLLLAARARR